jgi:hypothetical protein
VGVVGDRCVDPGDLLRDVVVGVDLRGAHPTGFQVSRGLVDALLEHRPERARVAVGDHREPDRVGRAPVGAERNGRSGADSGQSGGGEASRHEEAAAREPGLLDGVELFVGHHMASLSFRDRLERDVIL